MSGHPETMNEFATECARDRKLDADGRQRDDPTRFSDDRMQKDVG
jgi:hypothetical protein